MIRMIKLSSEFGDSIEDVQSLVSERGDSFTGITDVCVFMGLEDTDHIVVVEHDHEAGDEEEEPGYSHPQVDEGSGCFVLLIHVLLVVDVVCSHL